MSAGPLRAVDVEALTVTCIPGDLVPEQPDLDALEEFYRDFYDLVGHPAKRQLEDTRCHPDTPPEPRTSCL